MDFEKDVHLSRRSRLRRRVCQTTIIAALFSLSANLANEFSCAKGFVYSSEVSKAKASDIEDKEIDGYQGFIFRLEWSGEASPCKVAE